jgi:hypothetical protein
MPRTDDASKDDEFYPPEYIWKAVAELGSVSGCSSCHRQPTVERSISRLVLPLEPRRWFIGEERTATIYYICRQCPQFVRCEQCLNNDPGFHHDHQLTRVDLTCLSEENVGQETEKSLSQRFCSDTNVFPLLRDDFCPTCFNKRPGSRLSGKSHWRSIVDTFVGSLRRSHLRGCDLCSVRYRGLTRLLPQLGSALQGSYRHITNWI